MELSDEQKQRIYNALVNNGSTGNRALSEFDKGDFSLAFSIISGVHRQLPDEDKWLLESALQVRNEWLASLRRVLEIVSTNILEPAYQYGNEMWKKEMGWT